MKPINILIGLVFIAVYFFPDLFCGFPIVGGLICLWLIGTIVKWIIGAIGLILIITGLLG